MDKGRHIYYLFNYNRRDKIFKKKLLKETQNILYYAKNGDNFMDYILFWTEQTHKAH